MYDDAFTIQYVEKNYVDDFNYVAGMVPFLLNLIRDVSDIRLAREVSLAMQAKIQQGGSEVPVRVRQH